MRATHVHTQALETARSSDLLFWASRYNLFVLWSADRTHPWDALPGAASHTTLEIGKLRGSERDVRSTALSVKRDHLRHCVETDAAPAGTCRGVAECHAPAL